MTAFAITFGFGQEPTPAFPDASPDTFLEVDAPDEERARLIVVQLFGRTHWSGIYERSTFDAERWAPDGCIGTIKAEA